MVSVTLPADIEAWARERVAAGQAGSIDTFVSEALRQFRGIDDYHRAAIEKAYRSVVEGKVISETEMDAEFDRWINDGAAAKR